MTASVGIDYTDPVSFARLFPALVRRGFKARYELIGYEDWAPEEKWAYWATHVNDVRFGSRHDQVYRQLLDLVVGRDYFVVTSNVDALFARNGFEEKRLFTPQGDYALLQCRKPCTRRVWPFRPIMDQILPAIDPYSFRVRDSAVLPRCPDCGGEVFLNVRVDGSFIDDPYVEQYHRLSHWLREAREGALLVVEIGAGFNTPSVVRWPIEGVVETTPGAKLVRINLSQPEVPSEIADRSISVRSDAGEAIDAITRGLQRR
ncbi:MAG TPA: NAD-dependent protein deacetylase of SIR2 family [Chloroflexota bacterium]|nr:NAD-dependent protein deacetylase of SIR2 family [Chloroflexota bacterium]